MMDPRTGDYVMLPSPGRDALAKDLLAAAEQEGKVLLAGTEAQIAALSKRVHLGNAEMDRRRARRAQQKESRRRNR